MLRAGRYHGRHMDALREWTESDLDVIMVGTWMHGWGPALPALPLPLLPLPLQLPCPALFCPGFVTRCTCRIFRS